MTFFSGAVSLGDGATPTPSFTTVNGHGADTMSGMFAVVGDGNNDGILDAYLPGEGSFDFKLGNNDVRRLVSIPPPLGQRPPCFRRVRCARTPLANPGRRIHTALHRERSAPRGLGRW